MNSRALQLQYMTTQAKNSISMRLLPNHRQGESRSRPCSAVTDIGRKRITRRAPLPTAVVNLPIYNED